MTWKTGCKELLFQLALHVVASAGWMNDSHICASMSVKKFIGVQGAYNWACQSAVVLVTQQPVAAYSAHNAWHTGMTVAVAYSRPDTSSSYSFDRCYLSAEKTKPGVWQH